MRTKLAAATIVALAFMGLGVGTAWSAPDSTGACRNYMRDLDRVTPRELQLQHEAAWAGVTVEEFCLQAGEPFGG